MLSTARAAESTAPSLQDMQIVGRVLGFQATPPTGQLTLGIVYNLNDGASLAEAQAMAALLRGGLAVGNLILQPRLVDQAQLAASRGYDALMAASGLDEAALEKTVASFRIPCLTLHVALVQHAACTVAIRSQPNVSILVSDPNAAAGGVRFATAFRMMVQEL